MHLDLHRLWFTDKSTIGELFIAQAFECYILEDRVRAPGVKIQNQTAIPMGTFKIIIDYSQRFKRYMPHLLNVLMFTGVRIHWGNWDVDTDGCLLTGAGKIVDEVLESRLAFGLLFGKIAVKVGWDDINLCDIYRTREDTDITIVNTIETDTRTETEAV